MDSNPLLFSAIEALASPLESSDPPSRIVAGSPRCAERVIAAADGIEIGIWEVTAGRFLSAKPDSGEVMHFIAGSGTLTHPDGSVTEIRTGVTVSLQPGWSGEWNVVDTVRKVYTIYAEKPSGTTS
jgi:uncharacterized protein